MKNKTPWAPKKPKFARKCKTCKGVGKIVDVGFFSVTSFTCLKCGGKGFI